MLKLFGEGQAPCYSFPLQPLMYLIIYLFLLYTIKSYLSCLFFLRLIESVHRLSTVKTIPTFDVYFSNNKYTSSVPSTRISWEPLTFSPHLMEKTRRRTISFFFSPENIDIWYHLPTKMVSSKYTACQQITFRRSSRFPSSLSSYLNSIVVLCTLLTMNIS